MLQKPKPHIEQLHWHYIDNLLKPYELVYKLPNIQNIGLSTTQECKVTKIYFLLFSEYQSIFYALKY